MNNTTSNYSDIIDMPHHQSDKRPHMSLQDRAAQFAPFAALRGYDEEIIETARLTDERLELSNEDMSLLNERLHLIIDNIKSKPEASITYFVPDEKKEGGAYITVKGNVRRIDEVERIIHLTDNTKISIDDVSRIELEP